MNLMAHRVTSLMNDLRNGGNTTTTLINLLGTDQFAALSDPEIINFAGRTWGILDIRMRGEDLLYGGISKRDDNHTRKVLLFLRTFFV